MDFAKMKVADLKRELKIRGLSQVGNKNELQERLQLATLESDDPLDHTDILDEDVLNDDDLDEVDKSILEEESHIEDESLLSTSSNSIKVDPIETVSVPAESTSVKKIVLKRNISATTPGTDAAEPPGNTATTTEDDGVARKVVKLTEMTAQERIEMRLKKFGGGTITEANPDLKKQIRAERFGIKADSSTADAKPVSKKLDTTTPVPVSTELLKKRAERFGASVSSKLVTAENAERLAKRQERFGNIAAAADTPSTTSKVTSTNPVYAEKAQLRLQRFKVQ